MPFSNSTHFLLNKYVCIGCLVKKNHLFSILTFFIGLEFAFLEHLLNTKYAFAHLSLQLL